MPKPADTKTRELTAQDVELFRHIDTIRDFVAKGMEAQKAVDEIIAAENARRSG